MYSGHGKRFVWRGERETRKIRESGAYHTWQLFQRRVWCKSDEKIADENRTASAPSENTLHFFLSIFCLVAFGRDEKSYLSLCLIHIRTAHPYVLHSAYINCKRYISHAITNDASPSWIMERDHFVVCPNAIHVYSYFSISLLFAPPPRIKWDEDPILCEIRPTERKKNELRSFCLLFRFPCRSCMAWPKSPFERTMDACLCWVLGAGRYTSAGSARYRYLLSAAEHAPAEHDMHVISYSAICVATDRIHLVKC